MCGAIVQCRTAYQGATRSLSGMHGNGDAMCHPGLDPGSTLHFAFSQRANGPRVEPGATDSHLIPEVFVLQWDFDIRAFEQGDNCLQIIPFFACNP